MFNLFLKYLKDLFEVDYFLIGGGISECGNTLFNNLHIDGAKIIRGKYLNKAGMIGASLLNKETYKTIF